MCDVVKLTHDEPGDSYVEYIQVIIILLSSYIIYIISTRVLYGDYTSSTGIIIQVMEKKKEMNTYFWGDKA